MAVISIEDMITRMVEQDIADIRREIHANPAFLMSILLKGWIGYHTMTEEEIREEYKDREFED